MVFEIQSFEYLIFCTNVVSLVDIALSISEFLHKNIVAMEWNPLGINFITCDDRASGLA